jgi:hypothetical protein
MTRYYFNENPQVTALKEAHEKEIKNLKKAILIVDKAYRKELEEFNLLPWWKKCFFKFDI